MKELSIEEKAKRYDKALDNAKVVYETIRKDLKPVIEQIFPELKESEDDEKMWKLIKKYAHYNISDSALEADHITREYLESWLEKQGQGEQKIAEWHIEDEQNLNACLGHIPDEFLRRWLKDVIHIKYDKPIDKVEFEQQQEPTPDHWKDARERAAIAAMQGYMSCKCQLVGTINLAMAEGIAEQAILIADALVKKLKGE